MNKHLKIFLNIILSLTFFYGLFNIFQNIYSSKSATSLYDSMEKIYLNNKNEKKEENLYTDLKSINNDYEMWINIENTNINYPIVKGKDNKFYLKKDFKKNNSKNGTIFLDYRNSSLEEFNNIIYGHNMKDGTLFNNLELFKDKDFFERNNKITLINDKFKYTYEVFSVYIISGTEDASEHFNINKKNASQKEQYLENLKEKSLYKTNSHPNSENNILTLATCSYEKKNSRTIIHSQLTSKSLLN